MDELEFVIAFARDRQQHLDGPKLSQPDPWMLAAYTFDLQRRQNYLYMAHRMRTSKALPDGWPQTARRLLNEILNHSKFIDDAAGSAELYSSADWEARARMLELILRHQAQQIWPDTHTVLTEFFRVADPGQAPTGGRLPPLPDFVEYLTPPE